MYLCVYINLTLSPPRIRRRLAAADSRFAKAGFKLAR